MKQTNDGNQKDGNQSGSAASSSSSGWIRPHSVITLFSAKQPLKLHMDGKWRLVITKIGLHFQENASSLVKMELSSSDDLFCHQAAGGAPVEVACHLYLCYRNDAPAFTKGRKPRPCRAPPSVSVSHWCLCASQVIRNITLPTITPAVAVAMGTGD